MELTGKLATFSVGDVLQWASSERMTGAVRFRSPRAEVQVSFREGRIVGSVSTEPRHFFARHLLLEGFIDERELLQALQRTRQRGERLGEALLAMGLLSEDDVREQLARHLLETVCSVVLWDQGLFSFSYRAPGEPEALAAEEGLDPLAVAVEGARWQDEMRLLREVVPQDGALLRHGPGWPGGPFAPRAKAILKRLGPGQTVRALYLEVGGVWFRFLETLAGLVRDGVLEVVPQEGELEEEDREQLASWMREALDQRLAAFQSAGSVPLECLEGLFPLWTGEETAGADSSAVHAHELDGTRRLGDWLRADEDARARQVRWLLAELQGNRLSLLAG